jgi:ParB family chromosome partitioning protein
VANTRPEPSRRTRPEPSRRKRSALPVDPASFVAAATLEKPHFVQTFQASPTPAQVNIPIDAISPSALQPRKVFDPERLRELAASIAEVGILEPLLVRPANDGAPLYDNQQFQIVIGERRWKAAKEAGLREVPCLVRQLSDADAFLLALSENIQRDDLTPLEEAEAYQHLIQEGAVANQSELARRLGISRARISQKMRLVHLDHHSKQTILQHPQQITEHHAQQLLRIPSLELRHQALDLVVETGASARSLPRRLRQLASFPHPSPTSETYQVSHHGFSLRIALDVVDRERAIKDLLDAVAKLESAPPAPHPTVPDTPLPGLD